MTDGKQRAIEWVEQLRNSIPDIPAVKDKKIALMVVVTRKTIKILCDKLHRDIEEA